MNNTTALRSLVTFGILIPVAIILGYMLADPLQYSTFATVGIIFAIMAFPILLKWHQPLLLLCWSMNATIPFIKGQPSIGLVMAAIAFGIAVLERSLNRNMRFIQVWQVTAPLLFIVAVVLLTAKLTGGFGLRAFGSEVYGGKKYIFLLAGIASYFAITAWKIPPERAILFVTLYFLGAVTGWIGDLFPIAPSWLQPLFWIFPPAGATGEPFQFGVTRLIGTAGAAQAVVFILLLHYGIRGIFLGGKIWRAFFFLFFFAVSLLGGFRSTLLAGVMVFAFQFYLEGLHKTKLLAVFVMIGILGAALLVPTVSKLPFTIQRALAFLPLEIDPVAKVSAEDSSQWRLDMWAALLPQVPEHLLLGKGYAISQEDYQMMGYDSSFAGAKSFDASQQGLALAGDYHNGPLSVIIPFGIWGAIGFLWFLIAGARVMYHNYKYGDPALQSVNRFLWALFLMRVFFFFFVVGAFHGDMWTFVGLFGLSVSLNNGVARKPAFEPVQQPVLSRPRLLQPRPSFQR